MILEIFKKLKNNNSKLKIIINSMSIIRFTIAKSINHIKKYIKKYRKRQTNKLDIQIIEISKT